MPLLGVIDAQCWARDPGDQGKRERRKSLPVEQKERLLTTVVVNTFEEAPERAEWYAARWGIEVFHRTLKSGCRILRIAGWAQPSVCKPAWVWTWSWLGASTSSPCSGARCQSILSTAFFEEVGLKVLYCNHHQTPVAPEEPPSMAEAIAMLAAMGGHLGRRRDGPPGTQVLWRGLQRLDKAVQMYIVFTRSPPPNSWHSQPDGYLPPPNAP